jgi:uroporphyrin-3 C-methyltransferase
MEKDKSSEISPAKDTLPSNNVSATTAPKSALDQPVDALRQPKSTDANAAASTTKSAVTSKPSAPSSTSSSSGSAAQAKTIDAKGSKRSSGSRTVIGFGALAVILIGGLSAVVWWQNQRFETVAREVADRLQRGDARVALIEQQAKQALSLARSQAQTVEQTASRLRVVGNELAALEQSWQASNVGLDQKLLVNDLRRLLTMANQQLVLMGNVSSAIAVLQSMQVMLESQSSPEFNALTQAVNTDLSRLQEVPLIDLAAISAQLDSVIALTGKAPLLVPDRVFPDIVQPPSANKPTGSSQTPSPKAVPEQQDSESSSLPWWQQLPGQAQQLISDASRVMRDEVSNLVSIRRANDAQALLLTEDQAQELRANVRSRLLSAQLALLTRQTDIWRAELEELETLLSTRYDTEAIDTKAALRMVKTLAAKPLTVALPKLADSLSALELLDRAVSVPPVRSVPSVPSVSGGN